MGKTRYVYRHGKRIQVGTLALEKPAHRRKSKPFEVKWIQIPAWWAEALENASAGAHRLALVVLAEAFKRKYISGDIVLSSEVTKMPSTTRARAAKELVGLGLIAIEQSGKRAATVSTIYYKKVIPLKTG